MANVSSSGRRRTIRTPPGQKVSGSCLPTDYWRFSCHYHDLQEIQQLVILRVDYVLKYFGVCKPLAVHFFHLTLTNTIEGEFVKIYHLAPQIVRL